MKPLFRWTVGPCIPQGLNILEESVRNAVSIYENEFDWLILYNNLNDEQLARLKLISSCYGVEIQEQKSSDSPFGEPKSIAENEGKFPIRGDGCTGSIWKLCPPRMRISSHEIIADNDLIITSRIEAIDEFLLSTDKALVLSDRFQYYGRYTNSVIAELPKSNASTYLNSGLIGLPPGYDFGKDLSKNIEQNLTQSDEQGLVVLTLLKVFKENLLVIYDIVQILAGDNIGEGYWVQNKEIESEVFKLYKGCGYHFCQANKIANHIGWELYRDRMNENDQLLKIAVLVIVAVLVFLIGIVK